MTRYSLLYICTQNSETYWFKKLKQAFLDCIRHSWSLELFSHMKILFHFEHPQFGTSKFLVRTPKNKSESDIIFGCTSRKFSRFRIEDAQNEKGPSCGKTTLIHVFNFADSLITVGAILYIWFFFIRNKDETITS